MIAIYLSPLYILFNILCIIWIHRWLRAVYPGLQHIAVRVVVTLVYIFFASCILIGFLIPYGNSLKRVFMLIGDYWLGITLYTFLTLGTFLIIRRILLHTKYRDRIQKRKVLLVNGLVCILIISSVSIYGIKNAKNIRMTHYDVTVDKECDLDDLNIVLIADLHLGYNTGCKEMEQMVEKINAQDPDMIVIAGDFFDNDYDALDNPDRLISILSNLKSTYGTYAVYGNHDVKEKILAGFTFDYNKLKKADPRMDEFIEKCGITLLKDDSVLIDDAFYLYGKVDYEKPQEEDEDVVAYEDITEGMDTSKPIILLEHEPVELDTLKDLVDIDLNGHVHDGQVFPLNIITDIVWTNPYGYQKIGNMHSIVTSGVGVYGPDMRVGTIAEIVDIQVTFKKTAN